MSKAAIFAQAMREMKPCSERLFALLAVPKRRVVMQFFTEALPLGLCRLPRRSCP
jgi:hypothetical protein